MGASLDTDTSIESIEALDFEVQLPCELMDECPKVAEWRVLHTCCNAMWLACTHCMKRSEKHIREWKFPKCAACARPITIDQYVVTRLSGDIT